MENTQVSTQNKKTLFIFLFLLSGLLFVRFPFVIALAYNALPIPFNLGAYIYGDAMYLIIALMIILKRDSLADYNIGICPLAIFILAPAAKFLSDSFLWKSIYSAPPNFWSQDYWFRILISVCLLIVLLIYRPKLRKRSLKKILLWSLIAVAVGIGSGVIYGYILIYQAGKGTNHASIFAFINMFITQLTNAAVREEPLFRGFLWGALRKIHWKEYWIWLFQAVLFMLAHIYYLGIANYSFWIAVPFVALVLGLLAWRSKSIGTSMIAHGLINSVASFVAHFTW